MSYRKFAVIEDSKVINIIVDPGQEEIDNNPGKYTEYTDGWNYPEGIDGTKFFPVLIIEPTEQVE